MEDLAKKLEESLPIAEGRLIELRMERLVKLDQRGSDAEVIMQRMPNRAEFLNKIHDYMMHPRKESPYEWLIARLTGEVKQ